MTKSQEGENKDRVLPAGWRWARLGDIARVYAGSAAPQGKEYYDPQGPPFIRVSDLGREKRTTCLLEVQNGLSEKSLKEIPLTLAKKGSVLFPKSGAAIMTNNRAILGLDAYIVSHLMAVEPTSTAISDWLYWSLCRTDMASFSDNVTYPSLRQSTVEKIEIPLPPLSEQKRIAATLNEQMATVEGARAAAAAQFEAAGILRTAHLRSVFESPEARAWPRTRLGDAGDIASGVTLGRQLRDAQTRRVPYLRVANVKDGHLDVSGVYEIEASEREITKLNLRYGDLLLTEGGDPDKLGRGTYWEEQLPECIHQNHIFRVRFDLDRFCPRFMSVQIGSSYGKAYFLAHAKRTTGIATINRTVLSEFPLMIPPFNLQKRIAALLSEKMALSDRVRHAADAQLEGINKLPAALLQRALRGEL